MIAIVQVVIWLQEGRSRSFAWLLYPMGLHRGQIFVFSFFFSYIVFKYTRCTNVKEEFLISQPKLQFGFREIEV